MLLGMAEDLSKKFIDYIKDIRKDEIKSIVFGLFALIGFIILIYSISVGIVGEPLASVADTVFVAVLIGSFTLVGLIIGRTLLKK
jgi:DNA integrity scanning protein DisA with diadenylate cyclase activity